MRVHCLHETPSVWRIRLQPDEMGRSAISAHGLQTLQSILQEAQQSRDCRVLLLEGEGGQFCEGMDLNLASSTPSDVQAGIHQYAQVVLAMREAPQTIVGLIDGVVRAGGVGLVAACDLVLATETSTFGLPEIHLGLLPAMVMPLLLERMPPQKARRWILTGQTLQATEALHLGLVDTVVANTQQLDKQLRQDMRQLLRAKPQSVAQLKTMSLALPAMSLRDGVLAGADYTADCLNQPDILDGLRTFLAQEPLPWFERYRPQSGATAPHSVQTTALNHHHVEPS